MKTRLFAASLLALLGCGSAEPQPAPPPPPVAAAPPPAPEAAPTKKGKPEIGTWGFDATGMDKAVAPGNDFYRYADGTWLKTTQIPADKSNYGLFTVLGDKADEHVKEIIAGAKGQPGSEEQKVADYYKSFLDEAAIEAKGTTPIKAKIDAIKKARDAKAIVAIFAAHSRRKLGTPLVAYVDQDDKDPEHHVAHVRQGGLGLPDKDMYDPKNKQFSAQREAYKKYAAAMFKLVDPKAADADKRAEKVYALEEKLANVHWTRTQNRDPVKTYNKMGVKELAKAAPGIDWAVWLKGAGFEAETQINVVQPSAISGTAALVKSEPVPVWRDYLILRVLSDQAPYLPKKFVDAHFEMYGKVLSGTPELKERWKRGVDQVTAAMGESVGKLYVAKHFPPDTKSAADDLVKNLLVSMGQRIDELKWMGTATKAKAKEKLATYNPKIGYPKKWRDYAALNVVAGDAIGNAERANKFEYDRNLAKLGKPVDRDEWHMTPMTVNAYYNATLNEIVFPAAILQPPFFDANADDAVNYGGIGAVIGHEISHGFDDKGSQYDAKGALSNWWTADDRERFKNATTVLVSQYDAYCPFPAAGDKAVQCVQGKLTLGENIADVAGLTIALNAYRISLGGKPAPVIDGFSGEQRFFLGFAQIWRRLYRDAELSNRLVTDTHSPSEYRVDTIRNIDAWYEAFKVQPNDKLFLAPEKRVKIW